MKPEEEKSQQEKLEEEISLLVNKIKNTEYDLQNMFKGNAFVKSKLENTKKILEEKQKLLEQIKSQPQTRKALNKIESGVVESQNLTEEQVSLVRTFIEKEI